MILIQVAYLLGVKPFDDIYRRKIELFNEVNCYLSSCLYILFAWTSSSGILINDKIQVGDPELEEVICNLIKDHMLLILAVNLLSIFTNMVLDLRREYYLK